MKDALPSDNSIADRIGAALIAVAFLALLAAIATSPEDLVFDENRYEDYPALVRAYGFSFALLEQLNGAVGPLYGVFHFLLGPLTGDKPLAMRLANAALLPVIVSLVVVGLRYRGLTSLPAGVQTWPMAAAILCIPMTWVLAGLALTDLPTLVFVAANLALQLRGIDAARRGTSPLPWFGMAGVALGIAVLGRQTAGVLAVTPLLIGLIDRRLLGAVLIQAAIAFIMALPLLIAWGGPVPPLDDTEAGFAPGNAVLSLGYLFVGLLLLAPAPGWLLRWPSLAGGLALLAVNTATGWTLVFPLASFVDNLLPDPAMYAYGVVCGGLLLWGGAAFLVWVVGLAWQARRDTTTVLIHASLVAVSLAPAFIANVFSSRCAAMALPYLILAAAPYRGRGAVANLKFALGCALGLAALLGYYWGDLTSELVKTI